MNFTSLYKAHLPDPHGYVQYTKAEEEVWQVLYKRQIKIVQNRATEEFLSGIKHLDLNSRRVPQLPEVSEKLLSLTGWQVVPVEALISARSFFELLAKRKFPAATFIRSIAELDYVTEPDLFHELFGHCPMLTNQVYADFLYNYAQIVLTFSEEYWPLLQRLFWYTVEFGLLQTAKGLRIYGGGILSSIQETAYSIESDVPLRVMFAPVVAFRMPYRIDQLQPVYFVINSYDVLYDFLQTDIMHFIQRAKELGEYPPFFALEKGNPNIHIHNC